MGLIHAAKSGELSQVKLALNHGANLVETDDHGRTALHVAASEGYDDIVRYLLGVGADINALDNDKWTPLFSACIYNKISTIELLLDNKANPNICPEGASPLLIAAEHPTKELIQKFISAYADLNYQLDNFSTAMHLVALSDLQDGEKLQIMKDLFDAGALLLRDDCSHTPADCLAKYDLSLVGEFNEYIQSKM